MSEKPTTVVEAGGQVFKALRNFVELVQEEALSKYSKSYLCFLFREALNKHKGTT